MRAKLIKLRKLKKLEARWSGLWSKQERLAFGRILNGFGNDDRVMVTRITDFLLNLKLTSFKKDLAFFGRLLQLLGWKEPVVGWLKKAAIAESKKIVYRKRNTRFPSKLDFQSTLEDLLSKQKAQEILFLACVLGSGRRGCEIARLETRDMAWISDKLVCKLPWSKTSLKPICFEIDLDLVEDWLEPVLDVGKIKAALAKSLKLEGSLFRENIHKNFTRILKGFNLHAIRSVTAIFMVRGGATDSEVMTQLGWVDNRMLLRYLRVTPGLVSGQLSVDAAIELVRNFAE